MVRLQPLELRIGVRVPASQPLSFYFQPLKLRNARAASPNRFTSGRRKRRSREGWNLPSLTTNSFSSLEIVPATRRDATTLRTPSSENTASQLPDRSPNAANSRDGSGVRGRR